MHALPFLPSHMADDLTKALIRLQHVTHEPWAVDWQRFGLVCKHGVLVNHWHVLAGSATVLHELITARHATASVHGSRTQLQERPQGWMKLLFRTRAQKSGTAAR